MIHPSSGLSALKSSSRRTLFKLFGIPWTVTRGSVQFLASRLVMGLLVAIIFHRDVGWGEWIRIGLVYALLVGVSNIWHILGHQLSGSLVNAPMTENLVTQYSILTFYDEDPDQVPGRIHLARAMGGPLATFALSAAAALGRFVWPGHYFTFLALLNVVLGVMVTLPIPHADGEVIWREVRRRRG